MATPRREQNTVESGKVMVLSDKCEGCVTKGIRRNSHRQTQGASHVAAVTPGANSRKDWLLNRKRFLRWEGEGAALSLTIKSLNTSPAPACLY